MDYSIPMRPREPPRYYDEDYPPDPYAARDPRRSNSHGAGRDASPPRRHKSQRHRRAPSLDDYPEDPYDSRRQGGGGRRHHREPSPMAAGAGRRYASPEPRHAEPRHRDARHSSRREPAGGMNRDYYERDAPPPARGGGRYRSPSPEPRRRPRHDDFDAGVRRSRTMPQGDAGYGYDSRGRAYPAPPPPYGAPDDRDAPRRRRPTSQTRGGYDRDPSPRRGRPPPAGAAKAARPAGRRNSMPATTKNAKPWWQNPLIQAGARAAFTSGAQAAMRSRDDPSPWLGPKGAKVATAALGAAFVDGFIGKKHPGGVRHNVMQQGVDMATAAFAAQGASRSDDKHERRHRSSSRRRR